MIVNVLSGLTVIAIVVSSGCDQSNVRAYDAGHRHNACIANLRQIQGAKMTWMLEKEKTTNDIPTDADLFGETQYIKYKYKCADGGVYLIGRVGENPKCSVKGHTL